MSEARTYDEIKERLDAFIESIATNPLPHKEMEAYLRGYITGLKWAINLPTEYPKTPAQDGE